MSSLLGILRDLESNCNLDQNSNFDLYCLHLCFIHLMKSHLKERRENWNYHNSIKTTNAPRQLFLIGLMSLKIRAGIDKAYYPELDQVTRISSLTLSKLILYYYLLMFFSFRSPNYWM